jgi:hypothetical protein
MGPDRPLTTQACVGMTNPLAFILLRWAEMGWAEMRLDEIG